MRLRTSTLLATSFLVALPLVATSAGASDIVDGRLVFAKDALATYSFESIAELQVNGTGKITWVTLDGYQDVVPQALVDADAAELLIGDGLEGKHALRVAKTSQNLGLALQDPALLSQLANKRFSVSMWGRAFGAEPVLQLVYSRQMSFLGPELINVVAVRTGRETKDGWVEYTTGPIAGSALGSGSAPLAGIVLTARYPTKEGQTNLVDYDLTPAYAPYNPIDLPDGYAVIDAVEVRPEAGTVDAAATCTVATVATACGADQDCMFGHCYDDTFLWGVAPQAKDHRHDLADRWGFIAQSLQSDRQSIATAATVFDGAAATLEGESTGRYFAKLNDMVAELHDSHTQLGTPSTYDDALFPIAYAWSGPLDVCFGLADDDIGGSGTVYSVFQIETGSPFGSKLQKGDIVTAIDGMAPDAWLDLVKNRMGALPPDPTAEPSHNAIHMGELVGRYATTLSMSRCTLASGCAALPDIAVASIIYPKVLANEWPGGFSHACSLRFSPSVSMPPSDDDSTNSVVVETTGDGVTSVQFDGFQGLYGSGSDPYAAWKDPMTSAFTNPNVLVDARVGWGGRFYLGKWLFNYLRASDQPYGMFTVPRGTIEDPDPAWLLSSMFDGCVANPNSSTLCGWEGYNSDFTTSSPAGGEAAKVAWVNGNDVSMNDIVPRLMQGRANFRVFGAHPSHGSYGEISQTLPVLPGWGAGSIQVLDMRFGTSPDDARTQRWESGHGVVPDEVVVQKVSDILNGEDTLLTAAKAWLLQ